jgi:Ca2+/Na+ antiporter
MANVTREICQPPSRATPDGTACSRRTWSSEARDVVEIITPLETSIDRYNFFVGDDLIQEENTDFTYFQPDYDPITGENTGTGRCVKWEVGDLIPQGCAPFASEGSCSFACREYDDSELDELEEELEEEAVEIGEFLFHFSIMFYMCLALALVCEDFFVASLEIIIDKLKLPPDVAGATFMAAGSSSPELFVATVAVFAVGDAGQRCALMNDSGETEFALSCDTPQDSLGWLLSPEARGASGELATSATDACSLLGDSAHLLGQKIYIDEGVGVGAVVGSTMFNTLCIIGGSAVVSGKISKLDWRIILRDGTTYMVAIFTLAYVLNFGPTGMEEHPVLAFFNKDAEGKCGSAPIRLTESVIEALKLDHWGPEGSLLDAEKLGLETPEALEAWKTAHTLDPEEEYCEPKVYGTDEDPLARVESSETIILLVLYCAYIVLCAVFGRIMDKCCPAYGNANSIGFAEMGAATTSFDAQDKTNRPTVDGFEAYKKNRQLQNRRTVVARQLVGAVLRGEATYDELTGSAPSSSPDGYSADVSEGLANGTPGGNKAKDMMDSSLFDAAVTNIDDVQGEAPTTEDGDAENGHGDGHGEEEHHVHNIWEVPSGKAKVFWAVSFPLMVAFTYTIPDCRRPRFKTWYVGTFCMSIAWMGALVEVMVEHAIEAFHEALGVDMGPLGLTFVAAGTSFPDFLASMLVAKKGLADMAVSNAFGSNIFDVLLGLGWPWMMQTTIVDPGAVLYVGSMSFLNNSFTLLIGSYFIWLFVLSCVKWNLAPLMGVVMCASYFMWASSLFF